MTEGASKAPRFSLGRIVATRGALGALAPDEILSSLLRHAKGDWGDVCRSDHLANERALDEGTRLVSVYHSAQKAKFYIITEWDRSLTTVLLASEY